MYRPPNARVSLWDDFNISIERAFDVNPNIIIMGYLNENLLNINNINLRNILLLNNLENSIVEPTRITPTSSRVRWLTQLSYTITLHFLNQDA